MCPVGVEQNFTETEENKMGYKQSRRSSIISLFVIILNDCITFSNFQYYGFLGNIQNCSPESIIKLYNLVLPYYLTCDIFICYK